eukprot:1162149-Pelagomonas_calceolata.AAC.1
MARNLVESPHLANTCAWINQMHSSSAKWTIAVTSTSSKKRKQALVTAMHARDKSILAPCSPPAALPTQMRILAIYRIEINIDECRMHCSEARDSTLQRVRRVQLRAHLSACLGLLLGPGGKQRVRPALHGLLGPHLCSQQPLGWRAMPFPCV